MDRLSDRPPALHAADKSWTLYWRDRNLRFHLYEPMAPSHRVEDPRHQTAHLPPLRWGQLQPSRRGQFRLTSPSCAGLRSTVDRVTEISARSDTSFEDAVNVGLDRANATLRNVKSAWIKEQSVDVENGVIVGYRVNLLVTFVLE